jgi:RsiW-degrading membrane proteinase PrsW (M82 family)
MRPNQRQHFTTFFKWLAIAIAILFVYYHPIAVLVIIAIIVGLGVLLLLFLNKVVKWLEDVDLKNLFK